MRRILQIVSFVALTSTLVPPLVYAGDGMTLPSAKLWMLAATIVWFVVTPLWMGRETRH